jgi:hypothetical protein
MHIILVGNPLSKHPLRMPGKRLDLTIKMNVWKIYCEDGNSSGSCFGISGVDP